ncbi:MAG: gliding motility protein GldL [Saprospiraceae bacterium]|nr:gliding motility protein GldL [Saprospiraceae bacterium]
MSFVKTKSFKYAKNLLIGVGAAIVLMGALFKLESWEGASEMLIFGLSMEAVIFLLLGVLGPEPDYYWHKLYPGLDDYNSRMQPLTAGPSQTMPDVAPLHGDVVERQLGGMLTELQSMSKSLGALKALQEVDFSGTQEQIKSMSNFYTKLNEAMSDMAKSAEDVRAYKDQMASLNKNLGSLNTVYGNMLAAMSNIGRQ